MTATRGIGIVVLIAVVGLAIAPLATAGFSNSLVDSSGPIFTDHSNAEQPSADGTDRGQAADTDSSSETSVSEFLQSSAANTEATVDIGLFNASYDSADTELRKSILSDRTDALEERTAELEAEKERLEANEDEMSAAAYNARMTRLTIQISALDKSIDTVEQRAVDTDLNTTGLAELRSNAADLGGPNVSAVAEGLTGVEPTETLSGGIQEQVNESTPDIPEIDVENVTDEPELSTGNLSNSTLTDDTLNETDVIDDALNETDAIDDTLNETDAIDDTLNETDVTDDALNETDTIDDTLNATEETLNATNGSSLLDETGNDTSVTDDTLGDNSTEDESDGNESDDSETDEGGLDGLLPGDLEPATASTH